MATKSILNTIVILIGIVATSCDQTCPILIYNSKADTVTVVTETTIYFNSDEPLIAYEDLGGTYDHKIIKFKMPPGKSILCGMTIGGIQDEMPFTIFNIYSERDSIIANTPDKILNLFEKTFWGNIKTPYCLRIQ